MKIGHPDDPNFGKELGLEIAKWAANVDNKGLFGAYEKEVERDLRDVLSTEARKLLMQPTEKFNMSFALNNLMAEQFGESRILIWRPVVDE